jgi:hypothetical protein
MVKEWNGHERRKPMPGDKEGRRTGDQYCGQHSILWDNNEKNRADYRATTCGKLSAINAEIKGMVSWKIFAFLFTFSVLVVGSGFHFFGTNLAKLADRQEASMDALNNTISSMAATQAVMLVKIGEIEKRQDILRDQNIRIMQDGKPKPDK